MSINLKVPDLTELKPRITVFGVGGAGGNAVNNMIDAGLEGVQFVVANTDAQALTMSLAERRIQMGAHITEGLGAGSKPDIGGAAAEEAISDIKAQLAGSHMAFITAGMGGGTGTGAAPVIAQASKDEGILTVGVVTKPFQFEGQHRMDTAQEGLAELEKYVDTLIVIPNQNLFRVATEKTTFADAFAMADEVLHSGVACITDLMVKEGLINLDFADVKAIMAGMGKAMMGTGEASGEQRAIEAAESAISNPLLDDVSMRGAHGLLISITGGSDLTLYEVDEAASRIREEVDASANIILGATFDKSLDGKIRVSVVATGLQGQPGAKTADETAEKGAAETKTAADDTVAKLTERIAALQPVNKVAGGNPQTAVDAGKAKGGDEPVWKSGEDVTIEKRAPQPAAKPAKKPAQEEQPASFVPQPPSVAKAAPRRMPKIEDFPPVAQRAMKAQEGEQPEAGIKEQKKKVGFLERLTGLGGSKKKKPEIVRDKEPAMNAPKPVAAEATAQSAGHHKAAGESTSRKRISRAAGTPKPAANQTPVQQENADLEIPAFLKRQAN
ncbi:MAG: cell division protein FtsZ [Hyphomicrobiaceae bacterium]|nr:cell division protein FtsZ [Hyphomicrobiaceae bacterium]